jgi:hypothetical protein
VREQTSPVLNQLLRGLMSAGVTVLGGPNAVRHGLVSPAHQAKSLKHEYGDLTICLEVVKVRRTTTFSALWQ